MAAVIRSTEARSLGFFLLTVIHRFIGQPIGVRVPLAADVLETDMSNLVREERGFGVQGLEPGVFDFIASEHLLNEQE